MLQTIVPADTAFPRFSAAPLPARPGVGLKHRHVAGILSDLPDIGFFEVHAENYMGAGGLPHAMLHDIRERYPLSLHGVGMSIGGHSRLDREHLARFKALVGIYEPGQVSEHLAWSTHDDVYYNDLLPLPYTDETLARVCDHVDEMQEAIGRRILIENPSTYVVFPESTWTETAFMAAIASRTGCGLLLDVNNVFVSAANHGTNAGDYIHAFPLHHVGEIHLAGHDARTFETGETVLIDTHDREVCPDVWDLYRLVLSRTGPLPTLVEWDNDVPEWPVLHAEAQRVGSILSGIRLTAGAA